MKLLQKTIRSYFIFSIFLLLIAIPVFYFVMQDIVTEDVDEDLLFSKEMMKPKIADALKNNTVSDLKFLDHDITINISPYTHAFDSLWKIDLYDSVADEMVPHRVLTSHFTVNGQPVKLEISMSLVDKDELIESIVTVQVFLLVLLLIGLFIINRNLSKRIWKPFYTTLSRLRNYKVESDPSFKLDKSSVSEFDDLNKSLEELTDRTYRSYLSQKEFTENASHEMQTPLAIFQSKVELLMQTTPLDEEQAQLISDLSDASKRMNRLNQSLTLLSRIENKQFIKEEQVSLQEVMTEFVDLYQPQLQQKDIHVTSHYKNDILVQANRSLLEVLVRNLLGNAIRHNHGGGIIDIALENDLLIIRNSGKSSPLNADRIFQRFYKESTETDSTGLGLEIVKQICQVYNYTIDYTYKNNLHTFTLRLKGTR